MRVAPNVSASGATGSRGSPRLLVLATANSRATIHRPAYLDYVGVKGFDADGQVVGERRPLGLYATLACKALAQQVPILRGKVEYVLDRAGFAPDSHDRKALFEVLAH